LAAGVASNAVLSNGERAVDDLLKRTQEILALAKHSTPGPWSWWTSNSVKRLSHERDGDVMYAYRPHRGDPPADLCISQEDMALIAAVPDMLAHIRALAARVAEVREECARIVDQKAESIRRVNTYRGKVDQVSQFAADMVDKCAEAIRAGE
jgi:hypothetical protein